MHISAAIQRIKNIRFIFYSTPVFKTIVQNILYCTPTLHLEISGSLPLFNSLGVSQFKHKIKFLKRLIARSI
jgi:hypothetical protein